LAAGLVRAVLPAATEPTGVAADRETTPVTHSGDAADDPGIWIDPVDPSRSVVIGNDKGGALNVYDLAGTRLQHLTGASSATSMCAPDSPSAPAPWTSLPSPTTA
jgi:3-phytase